MFKLMDKEIITILRNFLCLTGPMRVLDVKITCLLSITANCRISLLYQYEVCLVIFFFNDLLVLPTQSQRPPKLVIGTLLVMVSNLRKI